MWPRGDRSYVVLDSAVAAHSGFLQHGKKKQLVIFGHGR